MKTLTAILFVLALTVVTTGPAWATCRIHTITVNGKTLNCMTCCNGGHCWTTCN